MRGNLQLLAPGAVGVGVMSGYQTPPMSLLPQTNLPQNLPLVQNLPPQNFSIKDQHLLKPPPFMHAGQFILKVSLYLCERFVIYARTLKIRMAGDHAE